MNGFRIGKNRLRLGKKIGCILGSENCENDFRYKNIVRAYSGDKMILIRCNMNQRQWDLFCDGLLDKKELLKFT